MGLENFVYMYIVIPYLNFKKFENICNMFEI